MLPREVDEAVLDEILGFVKNTVSAIVDVPEAIKVNPLPGEQTLVVELWSDRSDVGKVIGRDGRNIRSIRTLFNAMCARHQIRGVIEFHEDHQF